MYPCGVGLYATCHLLICLISSKYVQIPTVYLDFARRTQRCDPCRHPRSREIPRFATCIYRFTLSGVSHMKCIIPFPNISIMHILTNSHTNHMLFIHRNNIKISSHGLITIQFQWLTHNYILYNSNIMLTH